MLDKFLVLLERFVAAHELIAANFAKPAAVELKTVVEGPASEPEQKPEEEEEPAPKAKAKKTKAGPDLDTLREEIKDAALKISTDGTDDCCDDFDDLLDAYKVRNVMKLKDEDIEDFHADLKDLAAKYFELED